MIIQNPLLRQNTTEDADNQVLDYSSVNEQASTTKNNNSTEKNLYKINLRNSFISPELAYTNEKRKFFDKIGYTRKQTTINTVQNSNTKQSVVQSNEKNQSPFQQNKSFQFVQGNPKDIDLKFMRRRNKADDSYYEKRVQTMSKNRQGSRKLQQSLICDNNDNGFQQNHVMKRLMKIRKQRQNNHMQISQNYQDDSSVNQMESPSGEYLTIIKNYKQQQQYISRTEANATANKEDEKFNPLCSMNNETFYQPQIMNYQQDDSYTNGTSSSLNIDSTSLQNSTVMTKFMIRRQNRVPVKKTSDQTFTQHTHRINLQSKQSNNKSYCNSGFSVSNDKSVDSRLKSLKTQSFVVADDDSQSLGDKSMISATTHRDASARGFFPRAHHAFSNFNQNTDLKKFMPFVPSLQGFTKTDLLDLFIAKCKDLKINPSKDQMIRFFDILQKNLKNKPMKLQLVDMGFGDQSVIQEKISSQMKESSIQQEVYQKIKLQFI